MEPMAVSRRVHVAPVGYENDRIVLPAERLDADRVVLLESAADDEYPYPDRVRERLDDRGIDHATLECDIFDLYDSIGTIAAAITANADDEVYVNLASGSKVTAIGGMIACMATGATPYYARAERYGDEADGVSEGVAELSQLPTYPIDRPSREQVAVLDYLEEHGPTSKKRLIDFGRTASLPFVADHDASNTKAEYRLLDSHVLEPLAADGYVELESVGRRKRVHLTDRGANTLRAFRYLLGE